MIRGADTAVVERAIADADPLPGTTGFAGRLPDGRLVRDVLGRRPAFFDAADFEDWAFDPTDLANPRPVPAGTVSGPDGLDHSWSLPDPDPVAEPAALDGLREAIDTAVADVDTDDLAVAFSGGVDSALLAATLDAPLYTVGFPDSHDVTAAATVAEALGRSTNVRELTLEDVENAVPVVSRAIDRTNAMDVQIAMPLYFVAATVAGDGYDRLALGQGADELFGGYAKVAAADHRVEADTVRAARREVLLTMPDQATRDALAVRAGGAEPVTPLLHDDVVSAALRLPESAIVADDVRKRAFRRVAADYLPERVARRPKKAVQYGSLVARELDRLARRAGFKRRMDDHVSQYVRSRRAEA
ncbi:MAG: asparagine synthase C-terminal domain-containing protein [Halanaeroarchaeum sp.]